MLRRILTVLAAGGAIALAGCAAAQHHPMTPRAIAGRTAEVVDNKGVPTYVSKGAASNVGVSAGVSDGDFEMRVFYANISDQPIAIDPGAIRVIALSAGEPPKFLDVLTAEEYMQKVVLRQRGKEALTTLLDTVVAAGGAIATTATGAVSTVIDSTQSIVSNTGLVQKMKESNDLERAMNTATYKSLIKPHMLRPGGFSSGRVTAAYEESAVYRVQIPAAGELHEIEFELPRP